jgi:hypothetical protein
MFFASRSHKSLGHKGGIGERNLVSAGHFRLVNLHSICGKAKSQLPERIILVTGALKLQAWQVSLGVNHPLYASCSLSIFILFTTSFRAHTQQIHPLPHQLPSLPCLLLLLRLLLSWLLLPHLLLSCLLPLRLLLPQGSTKSENLRRILGMLSWYLQK